MELTRRILKKLGIEQLNINCPDDENTISNASKLEILDIPQCVERIRDRKKHRV